LFTHFLLEFILLLDEQLSFKLWVTSLLDRENNSSSWIRKFTFMRFPQDCLCHRLSAGKYYEFFLLYIDLKFFD
jgi:hypothetical protein